jgi:hypothetical protein
VLLPQPKTMATTKMMVRLKNTMPAPTMMIPRPPPPPLLLLLIPLPLLLQQLEPLSSCGAVGQRGAGGMRALRQRLCRSHDYQIL